MPDMDEKTSRFRVLQIIPGWLWRLTASVALGGIALTTVVPWAAVQRGFAAFGGEYLLVLAAFGLPFCIFRR